MLTALKTLFGSKKFTTMIVGLAVALGARYGLALDAELVAAILGMFAVLIHAQGLADQGKEAAKTTVAATKQGGFAALELMIVLVTIAGIAGAVGCGLGGGASRVAGGFVDCMTPSAKSAVAELQPAFTDIIRNATGNDGRVDWAPVRAVAGSLKSDATRCAFTSVIAEVLQPKVKDPNAPQSAALQVDRNDVLTGFEAIRGELYGGARFKLASGTL